MEYTVMDMESGESLQVRDIDTVLKNLKYLYEDQQRSLERAKQKNKELEDEHWKDNALQEMKAALDESRDNLYRGFGISKEEQDAIHTWEDKHYTESHNAPDLHSRLKMGGAIGGSYEYEFCPTSIGTVGKVVCAACRNRAFREAKGDIEKYRKLIEKYDAKFTFQDL